MRAIISFALSLFLCASALGQATKRITVQLRHDDQRILRVIVLSTSATQDPQMFKEVLDKDVKDLLISAWYLAGVFRFDASERAFKDISGGWTFQKANQLKIADLLDGDVVIMHHPNP